MPVRSTIASLPRSSRRSARTTCCWAPPAASRTRPTTTPSWPASKRTGMWSCAALLVPPFNLLISPAPAAALEALARQLQAWGIAIPGVMALAPVSVAFAALWQRLQRCGAERGKELQAPRARSRAPGARASRHAAGGGRPPTSPCSPTGAASSSPRSGCRAAERDLFVARLDETIAARAPVAVGGRRRSRSRCSATARRQRAPSASGPSTRRASRRGRGFASAAVAELSRRLLADGRSWCLLFADVENPTSTALYRRLGYRGCLPLSGVPLHVTPAADLVARRLERLGLVAPGEQPRFTPLPGGVSSDIWRVDLASGPICIKRALPKLKVAADWRAPVERNALRGRLDGDRRPTRARQRAAHSRPRSRAPACSPWNSSIRRSIGCGRPS